MSRVFRLRAARVWLVTAVLVAALGLSGCFLLGEHTATVDEVEVAKKTAPSLPIPGDPEFWSKMNEYNAARADRGKPTGMVFLELDDGTRVKAANPYPDLGAGDRVVVKQNDDGSWAVLKAE